MPATSPSTGPSASADDAFGRGSLHSVESATQATWPPCGKSSQQHPQRPEPGRTPAYRGPLTEGRCLGREELGFDNNRYAKGGRGIPAALFRIPLSLFADR